MGEYIIKLKDPVEIIPKDQWDGTKNIDTFRFIQLGPGIYKDDLRKFPAIIGIVFDINKENDLGVILVIYEYEKGKYLYDWVKIIKGALKYDVKDILKSDEIFKALVKAIKNLHPDLDDEEFIKIVKSVTLAYVLYKYILASGIEPEFNLKHYYYTLYKHILKGNLDYETYITITGVFNTIIKITPKLIKRLKERFEEAYADKIYDE